MPSELASWRPTALGDGSKLQPYRSPSYVRPIAKSSPAETWTKRMPFSVDSSALADLSGNPHIEKTDTKNNANNIGTDTNQDLNLLSFARVFILKRTSISVNSSNTIIAYRRIYTLFDTIHPNSIILLFAVVNVCGLKKRQFFMLYCYFIRASRAISVIKLPYLQNFSISWLIRDKIFGRADCRNLPPFHPILRCGPTD